jgi:hypothetical protein
MNPLTALPKHTGHSKYVVPPRAGALLGEVVEIELKIAGKFFGVDHELPIRPWAIATSVLKPTAAGKTKPSL